MVFKSPAQRKFVMMKLKRFNPNIKPISVQSSESYTIVTDFGKPDEVKVESVNDLKKQLLKFKVMAQSGKYPYSDVTVYNNKDKDVTDTVFKKLRIME